MAMKLPFLRKRESSSFHCHPCEACARESGEQESSPIWTRVFLISGFPPAREQAWFPAPRFRGDKLRGNNIFLFLSI